MKTVIEFDLPEDEESLKTTLKANLYYCTLHDLMNAFRQKVKYESEGMSEDEYKTWEKAKELFWETLKDNGVADDF